MTQAYVSVGSNVDREQHIVAGVRALRECFGPVHCSSVFESPAVGFAGNPFYNLVVGFASDRSAAEVNDALHEIESRFGRKRLDGKILSRTLDLDLLLFGDCGPEHAGPVLPRADIERYAFVLRPLAEIAGASRHPRSGRRFDAMWADFDAAAQPTWRAPLDISAQLAMLAP